VQQGTQRPGIDIWKLSERIPLQAHLYAHTCSTLATFRRYGAADSMSK
jgi:hypothetical protein